MTTLTLLTLNPRSRRCRNDMGNPHDMHRTLMCLFPHTDNSNAREHFGVLWRVEVGEDPTLLLQSRISPDLTGLPPNYADAQMKDIGRYLESFNHGQIIRYRTVINPSRTLRADGINQQKPIPFSGIPEWWQNRVERTGIIPLDQPVVVSQPTRTVRRKGNSIPILAARIDGVAEIADPEALCAAISAGVGRAKAWGCGLLTVARSQS